MKINLPYLQNYLPLEFSDENLITIAEPNEYKTAETRTEILQNALDNPYGESFLKFINGGKRFLIIINDATRPTPTEAILEVLMPALEKISPDNICLLVATGAHRFPAEEEYLQILGKLYRKLRPFCLAHDSRCESGMVKLGITKKGTPVAINKCVFEADRIIATGSVEPHYFAGFTGGRKAFFPGIASYNFIEENHKLALSAEACSLVLEANPVHEDMMDALQFIKTPVFSLMTVLDREQNIAAAVSGNIKSSFYAAAEIAKKIFCVPVPSKADIVISVAKFPMDIDLYQSQKAIDNGALALKDSGVLILVSSCRDGIGDETYAKLLAQAANPMDAIRKIQVEYKLGYHKAAKIAETASRVKIVSVSELPAPVLNGMFLEKAASLQEAMDNAILSLRDAGIKKPGIIILPDGCVTVPVL